MPEESLLDTILWLLDMNNSSSPEHTDFSDFLYISFPVRSQPHNCSLQWSREPVRNYVYLSYPIPTHSKQMFTAFSNITLTSPRLIPMNMKHAPTNIISTGTKKRYFTLLSGIISSLQAPFQWSSTILLCCQLQLQYRQLSFRSGRRRKSQDMLQFP